jgi:hypothetical protein
MNSIFHTSQCGSTLLGALLSKSFPTKNEPEWTHKIHKQENQLEFIKQNTNDNEIIKYPSVYCYLMPKIEGKKVFVYRSLTSHINKLKGSLDLVFHLNTMTPNLHNKTKSWNMGTTDITIQTLLWMDRCFWAIEAKDLLLINAKDLFENQQKVAKKVCAHFGIEYVPVEINYDVKAAELNHTDNPIELNSVSVKSNFVEPPDVVDFELMRWVDNILEKHPKLKYFM